MTIELTPEQVADGCLIERASRALAELDIREKRRWDTPPDKLEQMLPAAIDHAWREYSDQAIAVLQAIREPSEAILLAMRDSVPVDGWEWEYLDAEAPDHWRSMIDAALSETPTND